MVRVHQGAPDRRIGGPLGVQTADGPEGLIDRKAPGQQARPKHEHRAALAAVVENSPIPAVHGAVLWRIIEVKQWIWDAFEISVSKQARSRELRAMGCRTLSALPRRHAQMEGVIEDFKEMLGCPAARRLALPIDRLPIRQAACSHLIAAAGRRSHSAETP